MDIRITHIDTACILLEINGYRILTDPTLDKGGHVYYHGYGSFSRKTGDPAIDPDSLAKVDMVLLSHHQHQDNFDDAGKEFTTGVPLVISTVIAARDLRGVRGLNEWETIRIHDERVPGLRITATPAQHRPWWIPEFVSGKVIGFVIEYDGQENGVVYISGDTVYFKGIEQVASRYKIDTGIFHVGSVQFRYLTGFGKYTMDSNDLIKAVQVLQPSRVIPIHQKGWSHFKETENHLLNRLHEQPELSRRLIYLNMGERTSLY
ncbi:MAG: MBL fold metallo-hydrolase [Chitinophagaceae bacterium]